MIRSMCRGFSLAVLALVVAATAWAQSAGMQKPKALVMTADNLMQADARHQALSDPATLLPGDVIRYQLRFTNITDDSIRHVVFNNQLPQGLRYMDATAGGDRDDLTIEYSIDGGTSYSAQPMIEVEVDGKRVKRPAPGEMYTHIRWTIEGWLQPNAQVTAEFKAHLPNAAGPNAEPDGQGRTTGTASGQATNPGSKE
jgi:uncharacterized repeat protein (TIGR01451 family)